MLVEWAVQTTATQIIPQSKVVDRPNAKSRRHNSETSQLKSLGANGSPTRVCFESKCSTKKPLTT